MCEVYTRTSSGGPASAPAHVHPTSSSRHPQRDTTSVAPFAIGACDTTSRSETPHSTLR